MSGTALLAGSFCLCVMLPQPQPGEEPALPFAAAKTRVEPLALPPAGSWGSLLRTRVLYTIVTVKTQPNQPPSE